MPSTPTLTHGMNGILYIKSGIACITFGSEQTNSMNSGIFGSGTWLGSNMISHNIRLHATIEQLEPIELIFFHKDKVEALCLQDPFVYKWLYHCSLSTQQQWLMAQVVSLYDREVRVIFALLEIARLTKQIQGSMLKVHTSQKQLSIIVGISRPRLNEVLKMLEINKEIIINRGVIHILQPEKLEQRLEQLKTTIQVH
ncbi:Crp/Fnr family transcriptional regulator [Vibrio atypicus]|uniref:Crp/Fnr family transcriptional regulator n=1 Tax=Vibrio atypicus TaxID=558271 RepID=UPI00135BAB95|nr:helix-turn-helix domain-containing protein [Vibrio atypicus]